MKKEMIAVICFCLAGILCACFFGYDYFSTYGFLNQYHMQSFAEAKVETITLFGNILWERGKLFFLICLTAYTPLKKAVPVVLRSGISFTLGMFLAACVMNMAAAGILFFLIALFPHGILYLSALLLIFRVDRHAVYRSKNPAKKRAVWYLWIVLLFLLGCILEATAGVFLLRWFVRIIV